MGVEKKAETMGAEAADAISGVATYAKEQVGDLASRSQGIARDADRQIAEYTGKSSDQWISQVTRLIAVHPWEAVAMTAAVIYLFGKLRA